MTKLHTLKILVIGIVTIVLSITSGGIALAGISKGGGGDFCKLCHTCGGDGGGGHKPLKLEYQGPEGCVNCHSSSDSSTTYTMTGGGETVTVPVVNYTGNEAPTTYLAGGNFWWVKEGKGGDDTKGHNVFLGEGDDFHTDNAPGNTILGCGTDACHQNLHLPFDGADMGYNLPGKYGCEGCHLNVRHHADDHPNGEGGLVNTIEQGWYRFLSGHWEYGVWGYEDDDWEAGHPDLPQGNTDHNEYRGSESGEMLGSVPTTTAFCGGCHLDYHTQESGENWMRHGSDAVIPNSGEYANAFGAEGSGIGVYDPNVPVARPGLSDPSGIVTLGTDMVMCLSCHRPHGSPYPKMLRWDLSGCFKCHTKK